MSYKSLFYLLDKIGKRGDEDYRKSLCLSVSNDRTDSFKDLTMDEVRQLRSHLSELARRVPDDPIEASMQKQRKKIFSMFHEMGWTAASGLPDYKRINGWLDKYGYLHKPLNSYTRDQLPALVTQVENLLKTSYERDQVKA